MVFEALYILFMAGTNGTDADNVSGMAQILKDALDVAIALIRTICTTLARLNYAAAQCIRDAVAANGLQHLHTLSQPLLLLIATIVVLLAMLDLFGAIAAMPMPVLLILSVLLWMLLP